MCGWLWWVNGASPHRALLIRTYTNFFRTHHHNEHEHRAKVTDIRLLLFLSRATTIIPYNKYIGFCNHSAHMSLFQYNIVCICVFKCWFWYIIMFIVSMTFTCLSAACIRFVWIFNRIVARNRASSSCHAAYTNKYIPGVVHVFGWMGENYIPGQFNVYIRVYRQHITQWHRIYNKILLSIYTVVVHAPIG